MASGRTWTLPLTLPVKPTRFTNQLPYAGLGVMTIVRLDLFEQSLILVKRDVERASAMVLAAQRRSKNKPRRSGVRRNAAYESAEQLFELLKTASQEFSASAGKRTRDLIFLVLGLTHLRECIAPDYEPEKSATTP